MFLSENTEESENKTDPNHLQLQHHDWVKSYKFSKFYHLFYS